MTRTQKVVSIAAGWQDEGPWMQANHLVINDTGLSCHARVCWSWLLAESHYATFVTKTEAAVGAVTLAADHVHRQGYKRRHWQELIDRRLLRITLGCNAYTFELFPPAKPAAAEGRQKRAAIQ